MELLIMACPASCAYNEIRVPLTGPECDTLASGTGIDGITDVCDYLQSLPVRLFDIQNHLEGLGNYGALPVNEDSKCKPSEAPTASSLVSEIARAINAITCFLCGVGGGSKSHFHDETGDFNQLATTPLNIPADLDINDTVIEDFDDYLVFWTWDGTTWTKNFVHDKADANSAFQTHNQNIPTPTYTTPLTPPANPEAGDTIIEQYLDGIVYWTFDGTNWVKNFTDSKDIHSYHVLQAGNAPSLTPIFPVPITTAQAGDTAIVRWDNGEAKYTYNGASWVLDWFNEDASGIECADVFPNNPNDCATPPAIQDSNGNVTVLNGNGNIPLDTTYNAGYVVGGNLRVPGAKLEIASVYTTPFVQNVPSPTGFTDSANLISTSITNTTTKNRLYYLSLYGIEFATSCLQGEIGHTLKVTGAVTYTVVSATKGNAGTAGNCDNVQTLYQPLVLTPGQSITINCAYHWQNAAAGAPTLTFNGVRLELTVTSHGMEN